MHEGREKNEYARVSFHRDTNPSPFCDEVLMKGRDESVLDVVGDEEGRRWRAGGDVCVMKARGRGFEGDGEGEEWGVKYTSLSFRQY